MNPKIKIWGLTHPDNIREVMALQPDYIGFIRYPGSKRFVGPLDANWVAGLQGVKKVGVFVNAAIDEVKKAIELYGFQAVQLHGAETQTYCAELARSKERRVGKEGVSPCRFGWARVH